MGPQRGDELTGSAARARACPESLRAGRRIGATSMVSKPVQRFGRARAFLSSQARIVARTVSAEPAASSASQSRVRAAPGRLGQNKAASSRSGPDRISITQSPALPVRTALAAASTCGLLKRTSPPRRSLQPVGSPARLSAKRGRSARCRGAPRTARPVRDCRFQIGGAPLPGRERGALQSASRDAAATAGAGLAHRPGRCGPAVRPAFRACSIKMRRSSRRSAATCRGAARPGRGGSMKTSTAQLLSQTAGGCDCGHQPAFPCPGSAAAHHSGLAAVQPCCPGHCL